MAKSLVACILREHGLTVVIRVDNPCDKQEIYSELNKHMHNKGATLFNAEKSEEWAELIIYPTEETEADPISPTKEVETAGAEYLLDAALYLVKKMEIVGNLTRKKALEEVAFWAEAVAGELRLRLDGTVSDE